MATHPSGIGLMHDYAGHGASGKGWAGGQTRSSAKSYATGPWEKAQKLHDAANEASKVADASGEKKDHKRAETLHLRAASHKKAGVFKDYHEQEAVRHRSHYSPKYGR
jgi:hypothetical protein